jgi:hypothetical protein
LREEFALQAAVSPAEPGGWYDCSAEEGIVDPVFAFSAVYSDPPIVTKARFHRFYIVAPSSLSLV